MHEFVSLYYGRCVAGMKFFQPQILDWRMIPLKVALLKPTTHLTKVTIAQAK
jgi:hypothetical protein